MDFSIKLIAVIGAVLIGLLLCFILLYSMHLSVDNTNKLNNSKINMFKAITEYFNKRNKE